MRFAPIAVVIVSALAAAGPLAGRADASVLYSYGTDAATYKGTVGGPVSVSLYLIESRTNASPSFLAAPGTGGLLGVGVAVNRIAAPVTATLRVLAPRRASLPHGHARRRGRGRR
jgi:hypothetical protein